jgi:uncharacterized small protein (DUF1192 family)
LIWRKAEREMSMAANVIQFPVIPRLARAETTHPVVLGVTEVVKALGRLASDINQWPVERKAKLRMLQAVRAAALEACELQLLAVAELTEADIFRADLERLTRMLRALDFQP